MTNFTNRTKSHDQKEVMGNGFTFPPKRTKEKSTDKIYVSHFQDVGYQAMRPLIPETWETKGPNPARDCLTPGGSFRTVI